ncbi:hypothetical protein EKG37_19090 [Robertmurraya yapensis]|uniref:Uncharacterized protein n=2 Tax=Bacillaceae TaxID=186817 RepID=A0A3S0I9D1_9BACI|nr:hypothetical protein [Bacillus yapensis]RTR27623.1 hypothetical protein EKG37_19090 [Bacillus yapensis]TKS94190.1 hypothetical protein FAR12_19100 [Bacillus yapensis]
MNKIRWKVHLKAIAFYAFKWILIFFIFLIMLWLLVKLHLPTNIPISLISAFITFVLTWDILKFFNKLIVYWENIHFSKPYKGIKGINLYRWAEGIEVEESTFYRILSDGSSTNTINNLALIKEKIEVFCSNDVTKLRLLSAFVERRLSNNILEKTSSILLGIVVSIVTSFLNKSSLGETYFQKVINYLDGSDNIFSSSNITIFIKYFTFFLIFLALWLYILNILTRDKKRLSLIHQIIKISIDEK